MKHWKRFAIGTFLTVVTGITFLLGVRDSHETNFRYLKWKYGRAPQDYGWCLHLLMVDGTLRDSMRGKPLSQLKAWLPAIEIPPPGSWESEWLNSMEKQPGVDYRLISATEYVVKLRDGKFDHAFPMKG